MGLHQFESRRQCDTYYIYVLWLIFMMLNTTVGKSQQQIHFTQYMFNGLAINPAYAGSDEALNLTFIHRSQWSNLAGAPETQTLSAHTLFGSKRIGLGLTLVNDKISVHKSFNLGTNYAYHLPIGEKSVLSMGLKAGFKTQKSNYAALASPVVQDPKLVDVSGTFFDFGVGIYYRNERLQAGFSIPEIIYSNMQFNDTLSVKLKRSTTMLFFKYRYPINDFVDIEPGFLVKYFSGMPVSYDINVNMIYRKVLTLGLSYRRQESIDFILKAQITPQLQVGYAYDHSIGRLAQVANGTHELMVQYLLRYLSTNLRSPR